MRTPRTQSSSADLLIRSDHPRTGRKVKPTRAGDAKSKRNGNPAPGRSATQPRKKKKGDREPRTSKSNANQRPGIVRLTSPSEPEPPPPPPPATFPASSVPLPWLLLSSAGEPCGIVDRPLPSPPLAAAPPLVPIIIL